MRSNYTPHLLQFQERGREIGSLKLLAGGSGNKLDAGVVR